MDHRPFLFYRPCNSVYFSLFAGCLSAPSAGPTVAWPKSALPQAWGKPLSSWCLYSLSSSSAPALSHGKGELRPWSTIPLAPGAPCQDPWGLRSALCLHWPGPATLARSHSLLPAAPCHAHALHNYSLTNANQQQTHKQNHE